MANAHPLLGPDEVLFGPAEEMATPVALAASPNPRRRRAVEHPALDLYAGESKYLVRTALIRAEGYPGRPGPKVTTGEAVARLCAHLVHADQEHMVAIAVDNRMQLRAIHEAAIGGSSSLGVEAQHLMKVAFLTSSTGMFMVHNHPSGSSLPSPEDISLTKHVKSALSCIGLRLVDHVIVSRDGTPIRGVGPAGEPVTLGAYYSFFEEGDLG